MKAIKNDYEKYINKLKIAVELQEKYLNDFKNKGSIYYAIKGEINVLKRAIDNFTSLKEGRTGAHDLNINEQIIVGDILKAKRLKYGGYEWNEYEKVV